MKNKIKYLPISILTLTTAVSGVVASSSVAVAATSASASASVTVPIACAFSSAADTSIPISLSPGLASNTEGTGTRNITVTCNSSNALVIQAIGVAPHSGSPSTPVEGYNALYNASEDASIASNTPSAAGTNSYWAFKVTSATADTDTTITNNFSSYSTVPTTLTNAIEFSAAATAAQTSSITVRTDYQVQASDGQVSGSYTGGVKYLIVDAT